MTSEAIQTTEVDPARLAPGSWCHRTEKHVGQGDISASYSADRIGMSQPIRKPFAWRGALWVCVSKTSKGGEMWAKAYRLVHPQAFDGQPVTYGEKTFNGDAARADPMGFYHGMKVRHGGAEMVLCGPPATLVRGKPEQGDLFA